MRSLLAVVCCGVLGVGAFWSAQPQGKEARIRLRLVDAETNRDLAGIIRVFAESPKAPLALPGLLDRLRGLKIPADVGGWYVVPASGAETFLPRSVVRIEAVCGIETERTLVRLDLTKTTPQDVTIKLKSFIRPEKDGLISGNTHLHLMNLRRPEADEYLKQIPAADGLRVMFISYLERKPDDKNYVTNEYPIGSLPQFEVTGVLFNNGEEHRHNFKPYGEGYGHVMFLNIKELVKPVSIGPGIMLSGFDDLPLRPGIDNARKQGGTVIWCHNTIGFEDVLNAITGRLDALNVFDGSRSGTFEENYYRYLNLGLRLPISTGTDWFMYDFSRVYAKVRGPLSIPSWLEAVKAGRCQATNGPLLDLKVDGHEMGDILNLEKPKTVRIEAGAVGRHNFQALQLVHNGKVIKTQPAEQKGLCEAKLVHEVRVDAPAWFAVRVESQTKNEFDKTLYAHSSPVYLTFAGQSVFDVASAEALLKQVEENHAAIKARGSFSSPQAEAKLLALYDDAAKELRERINQRK